MSESSALLTFDVRHFLPSRCVAGVFVAIIFAVLFASPGISKADGQQYSVLARFDAKNAGLIPIARSNKKERLDSYPLAA